MKKFLILISLLVAMPAFARDDRGRTRTYTGMNPYPTPYKIVCPTNGSRCYTANVSSASSESSVSTERGRKTTMETSVFIPFLKKYITPPAGWTSTVTDKTAIFTKPAANGETAGSRFGVELFDAKDCDANALEARMTNAWKAVGKPVPERLGIGRAYGVQGLAFSWLEPWTDDIIIRNFCVVPRGYVMTARVWTDNNDTLTKNMIERNVLPDLLVTRRGR